MKTAGLVVLWLCLGAAAAWGEGDPVSVGDTPAAWAPVRVEVTGLRNDRGVVKMALFVSREGFPAHSEKAWLRLEAGVNSGCATAEFAGVPEGEYAVAVFHDENQNGRGDTNFMGLPSEGVGVSNNAQGMMGPPVFKDARFRHGREPQTLPIRIAYLF
jgi:uncharacterized protein (DUF2141 family)